MGGAPLQRGQANATLIKTIPLVGNLAHGQSWVYNAAANVMVPGGAPGAVPGDDVSVNGEVSNDPNFNGAIPAAPADGVQCRFQHDSDTPDNVSANVPFATAVGLSLASVSAAGSAAAVALADHTHAIDTASGAVQPITVTGSIAEGTAPGVARKDHVHSIPSASAIGLDANSASGPGSSNAVALADHVHGISTAAPSQGVGGGNALGAAPELARADHDHALRTTAGGGADLTIGDISDGQFVKRDGAALVGETVNMVFGGEFDSFESLAAQAEAGTTYAQKARFTTAVLAGGTYMVHMEADVDSDTDGEVGNVRFDLDDGTVIYEDPTVNGGAGVRKHVQTTQPIALVAGIHSLDFEIRLDPAATAANITIQNMRAHIYRVA